MRPRSHRKCWLIGGRHLKRAAWMSSNSDCTPKTGRKFEEVNGTSGQESASVNGRNAGVRGSTMSRSRSEIAQPKCERPGRASSSTPRIQTMLPATSRTGQWLRSAPVTFMRSRTSLIFRGPEEWRRRTRSPGFQVTKNSFQRVQSPGLGVELPGQPESIRMRQTEERRGRLRRGSRIRTVQASGRWLAAGAAGTAGRRISRWVRSAREDPGRVRVSGRPLPESARHAAPRWRQNREQHRTGAAA